MKKSARQNFMAQTFEMSKPHSRTVQTAPPGFAVKRAAALACAGLLAFSPAGCGKKTDGNNTPSPEVTPTGAAVTDIPATPSPEPTDAGTPAPEPTAAPTMAPDPTAAPTQAPAVYGDPATISAYDTAQSNYTLSVDASAPVHEISDLLYGIFIEDINFAADGGLYAELVHRRDRGQGGHRRLSECKQPELHGIKKHVGRFGGHRKFRLP